MTGGARGIGLATARAFVAQGAKVAIGDLDADLAVKVAADISAASGAQVIGLPLDVTNAQSFASFLDINLRGVVTGSRLALAKFAPRRTGHVINMSSLAGVTGFPGLATYCASKFAVLGFTEALHREAASSGVGFTAILPGVVRTELSAGASMPRWVEPLTTVNPEDLAAAIVAAVGSDRSRITVPRRFAAALTVISLMPRRALPFVERLTGLSSAYTKADAAARKIYHDRIRSQA